MPKHPKGRSQRGKSVGKIIDSFTQLGKDRLGHKEIMDQTGLSRRTVSETLKELVTDSRIIHVVTPLSKYYMEADLDIDNKIKKAKSQYGSKKQQVHSLTTKTAQIESAIRGQMVDNFGKRIQAENNKTVRKMDPKSLKRLKTAYYKTLNQETDRLQTNHEEWIDSEMPQSWEHCANCDCCKRIGTKYGSKCKCTKTWRLGHRPVFELDHFCDDFEMRLPKGSTEKYAEPR